MASTSCSTSATDVSGPERLTVGVVIKPHGIRGELAIEVVSDVEGRFELGARVFAGARELIVASTRPHQGRVLVTFEGVEDRSAAEELRGAELTISSEEAATLPSGAYYAHDLEGCAVVDETGGRLGTLARVEANPAHDHWIVTTDDGEVMLPAVRGFIVKVDLDARTITVAPPEGLF